MSRPTSQQDPEGNVIGVVDDHLEQLKSASNQPSLPPRKESDFGDSSGLFFSIYSKISDEEDKKMTDRWQTDADSMLIFTGLFSAAVAALLAVSVQDLRQDPQDTIAFYIENIYQILANSNLPQASIPSPVTKPPPFSPPRSAIWVNSLWFLSLVISLTCALLATSLQQWARRYVRVSQPARCSPEKRARMRAFFAGGVDKMHMPWAVEALPALLHLSLFLFFSGVIVFLRDINENVFLSATWWILLYSTAYGCITFLPMLQPDSPYYTPLSTPVSFLSVYTLKVTIIVVNLALFCCVWIIVTICATVYVCFTCVWVATCSCAWPNDRHGVGGWSDSNADSNGVRRTLFMLIHRGKETWRQSMWLSNRIPSLVRFIWDAILPRAYEAWDIRRAAEQATSKRSSEIDLGILDWTIPALGEELEEFFGAIPGFFNSKLVKVSKISARRHHAELYIELRNALIRFLRHTLSSDSVDESVKSRRLDIYLNAMNAIYVPYYVDGAVTALIAEGFGQLPQSIEIGRALARWFTADNQSIAMAARYGVATILGTIQNRDHHWIALAKDQFGLSEQGLQQNISHGNDSVLLAIFLHMTRQVFHTDPWNPEVLSSLPKFDINNTRVELQIELCALWNQIALKAADEEHPYIHVLREIRHLYIALPSSTRATLTIIDPPLSPHPIPSFSITAHHPNTTITFPTQYDPNADPPASFVQGFLSSAEYSPSSRRSASRSPSSSLIPSPSPSPSPSLSPSPSPSRSPSRTTHPVYTAPHITDSFMHELSSSNADITATIRRDEPMPAILITEMEETSQTPAETLPTFPPSERVAVSLTPSTVARIPASVQQPDINEQQDIATTPVASHIAQISSTANPVHLSIANIGATLPTTEESTGVPPSIVSGSPSLPIMTPALQSSVIPTELSSSVEPAFVQPGHVLQPLRSLSSSSTPDVTPHVTSVLGAGITTSTSTGVSARERDGTHGMNPVMATGISLHEQQSEPSTHDIAEPPGEC